MLTLIDATGPYQLPTGWHEVSTAQYCAIDKRQLKTVEARASYFAGRPIQVNELVADCLAFMVPLLDGSNLPSEGGPPYPTDLGQETFLQVESIRALLLAQPLHDCYGEVYATFVARRRGFQRAEFRQGDVTSIALQCEQLPLAETYPAMRHLLSELTRLSESFAELAEPDPTEAAKRARDAGADEQLGGFGHFGIADFYAVAKGMALDQVYQTAWITVALWMLKDRRQAIVVDTMERNAKNTTA